jgi:L-lactate dehydrogenase (cytochrome)
LQLTIAQFSADPPLKTLHDLNHYSPGTLEEKDFQVFVDGGIRRGTDILKALCLGASAVGLGRPFIYAATGWGPEGVEKAIMS